MKLKELKKGSVINVSKMELKHPINKTIINYVKVDGVKDNVVLCSTSDGAELMFPSEMEYELLTK